MSSKRKGLLRLNHLLPRAVARADVRSTFDPAKNMVFRINNFGDQSAATRADGVIGNGDREITARVDGGKLLGASVSDGEERTGGKQEHKRASQQKGKRTTETGHAHSPGKPPSGGSRLV